MKTQIIEIKTGSTPINQIVEAVQGDSGRVLRCIISDMSIPAGSTARFYAVKPSGAEIYNDCAIDGQAVVLNMTTQMLAEVGTLNGQIEVTNSGKTVTSFSFCVNVIKNIKSNSAIESSNEFTALDNALKDAEGAAYKAVSEYAAANGLTTGATPEQVEQIEQNTLGIDELKGDLVNVSNNIFYTDFAKNSIINLNDKQTDFIKRSYDNMKCIIIDCAYGDVFNISGKSPTSNGGRLWAFCKNDGTIISRAIRDLTLDNATIIAPVNSNKLIVNLDMNYDSYVCKNNLLKNRVDLLEKLQDNSINIFEKTYVDSSFDISSYYDASHTFIGGSVEVLPNTEYVFSLNGVATNIRYTFVLNDGTTTSFTEASTFKTTNKTKAILFRTVNNVNPTDNPQLEIGNVPTEYVPHVTNIDHNARAKTKQNLSKINTIANEVKGLCENVTEINYKASCLDLLDDKFENLNVNTEKGKRYIITNNSIGYVPNTSTSISFIDCAKVEVKPCHRYMYSPGYVTVVNLSYLGFADENGVLIGTDLYIENEQHINNYVFDTPIGTKYLYVNGNPTKLYEVSKKDVCSKEYADETFIKKGSEKIESQSDISVLTGENLSVVDMITAYANGLAFDKDVIKYRFPLSDNFSHTSFIEIDKETGIAYITLMKNDVNTEDYSASVNTYVSFIAYDLINGTTVFNKRICGYGDTVCGQTVISGCAGLTLKVVNGTVYLVTNVKLSDNKWHGILFTHDISLGITSEPIQLKILKDGNRYDLTTDNFSEYVYHLDNLDAEAGCFCKCLLPDGYYYGISLSCPNGLIMRTNNFIDYEYITHNLVEVEGQYECDMVYENGYFYIAMREKEKVYATLAKIDCTTFKVVDMTRIIDAGSRLSFYFDDSKLYLIHSICNRERSEIILINKKSLKKSGIVSQPSFSAVYPSVDILGDWCWLTSTNNNSTRVYLRKFRKSMLTNLEVSNKMLTLLSSE